MHVDRLNAYNGRVTPSSHLMHNTSGIPVLSNRNNGTGPARLQHEATSEAVLKLNSVEIYNCCRLWLVSTIWAKVTCVVSAYRLEARD